MKLIIRIIVFFFATTLLGCKKDWLDHKANKTLTVPVTISDFQSLLDNAAFFMNYYSPGLNEVAADGHYVISSAYQNAGNNVKNAYTWSHQFPYNLTVNDWDIPYSKIFNCNLVIDGLKKLKPEKASDQQAFNDCKGQALFHRANTFFDLAKQYIPQYTTTTSITELGLPLRLSSDITLQSRRSTVKQTYDQIISDLKIAKDILPQIPQYLTRPSKLSANALLARVYLSMMEYDSAFFYSDKVLQTFNTLIDYNTLSTTASYIGNFKTNKEVLFHNVIPDDYSGLTSYNCLIDSSLYASYDNNDLRKVVFFGKNADGSIAFKGNYTDGSDLFSGLATDEMYLIRAECLARKGNKDAAISDLNALLITRWKNNGSWVPITANDANDALIKVLSERKKELLLRGLRWSDLKRLNIENTFKVTLVRSVFTQTFTLEPNSYKYSFPFPDDVIQLSQMQQNPGW